MSAKEPWFKLWATDYLCDAKVDALPLATQGLLVRMWCVCSQRGSIPDDPEEIARLTQCKAQDVRQCYLQCKQFFDSRNGLLYSVRMEAEKARSETARANAQKRYNKPDSSEPAASCTANGSANRTAQKARESESQKNHKTRDSETTLALTALAVPAPMPFLTVPLIDGSEFVITETKVAEWGALYLAIDVGQQIRAYKGWAINNPRKRKTRTGILKSINGWLADKQNQAGPTRGVSSYGNRAQDRTDDNVAGARRAFEAITSGASSLG